MFDYLFSVSLTFFGVFCVLIGYLTFRSKFPLAILDLLMMATGFTYWITASGSSSHYLSLILHGLPTTRSERAAAARSAWPGIAAAITSAVHHATGVCVRELSVRIEHLLA
jgi:hypothetical protein